MKPTRPALPTALAVALAMVTWAFLHGTYGALPKLPWTMAPTLLLLGLGEAFTAYNLWRRIRRRPGTRPVEPLVVARMVVLAKASVIAGAVLAGIFAGFLVYLAPELDKAVPRQDFLVGAGTFVASLLLIGAAIWLEYACRVPKGPEDEDRDQGASRA
ncbi:DUF3180 domain-containing protein [Thermomonospora catenispora]|uniref:DUF3180 domain-containing protein n=1 Tax=Thermomonospora catenispora TaxID=2493090 RepID=UPI001122585D|nr:DUF3180 domain-containing protein [Thermomonospora catenispora]TNY35278.1 DUF3180 domain-containing protein [Thermomonospora catenispora]